MTGMMALTIISQPACPATQYIMVAPTMEAVNRSASVNQEVAACTPRKQPSMGKQSMSNISIRDAHH